MKRGLWIGVLLVLALVFGVGYSVAKADSGPIPYREASSNVTVFQRPDGAWCVTDYRDGQPFTDCDCPCEEIVCEVVTPTPTPTEDPKKTPTKTPVVPTPTPTKTPVVPTPTPTPQPVCKIWLCHKPGTSAEQDYCCWDSEGCKDAHLKHGDYLGKCTP